MRPTRERDDRRSLSEAIQAELDQLRPAEAALLRRCFGLPAPVDSAHAGAMSALPRARVSQLRRRAMRKLRWLALIVP